MADAVCDLKEFSQCHPSQIETIERLDATHMSATCAITPALPQYDNEWAAWNTASSPVSSPAGFCKTDDMSDPSAVDDGVFGRDGINDDLPLFQPLPQQDKLMAIATTAATGLMVGCGAAPTAATLSERYLPLSCPTIGSTRPPRRQQQKQQRRQQQRGKRQTSQELKTLHNRNEKNYRDRLAEEMDNLRNAVPSLHGLKIKKGTVLVEATRYIKHLERLVQALKENAALEGEEADEVGTCSFTEAVSAR